MTVKLNDLISQIEQDQKSRIKVEEPLSFNTYSIKENVDQTTTGLNGHFVHSLLLIDVLLRMKTIHTDKHQLISLCNNEYKNNPSQLAIVREFEKDYSAEKALWWYSRESFLYKILNKALRTQKIDILFLFRFVIGDIYRQLEQNQCKSSVQVYRGQVMSNDEINNLRHSCNNFISINSFFSTSMSRKKAVGFLYQTEISDNIHRVLFEIDAEPQLMTSKPFADISKVSVYGSEQEVLFMMGCIFRLIDIRQNNDGEMWIVRMKLCGDDEHDLKKLFEHMKKDYAGGDGEVDLRSFGNVLRVMGKFDLAEKFYRHLLDELPPNDASLSPLYYTLGLVIMDKGDYDASLQWFHKSLEIFMRTNPSDYVNISSKYICIGILHQKKSNYSQALEWFNKGIELFKQAHDENHLNMAYLYSDIAIVYQEQENYSESLDNYNKSLEIYEKHLPSNHPDLGDIQCNTGIVHKGLGHHDLALDHYYRALQIQLKSLPNSHPSIANCYENIGEVYEDKGELKQALTYFEKADTIYCQSLPSQHPDRVRIATHIQRVTSNIK